MKNFADLQTSLNEEGYQEYILQGVSRTFALTIPTLPDTLSRVVGNAYLLCRIADTIEDNVDLSADSKQSYVDRFVSAVQGHSDATDFAKCLLPHLADRTHEAERDLIANTASVLRMTHSFSAIQRASLGRCVQVMAEGMSHYQRQATLDGLSDVPDMEQYCYYVAGVVGEMLTELFCEYCPALAAQRGRLMKLSVSFGQALQMTNILKDMWEDHRRGACWLPRDVFARQGQDIGRKRPGEGGAAHACALNELIAIAHGHLSCALDYTLMIPKEEAGIRRFCLWALGMSALTLSRIHRNPDFTSGQEVKISRFSVRITTGLCRFFVHRDDVLRLLFGLSTRRLPRSPHMMTLASGLR